MLPIRPHTVFILVGPTMCGKSTWARQYQEFVSWAFALEIPIVSSDETRKGLMLTSPTLGFSRRLSNLRVRDTRHDDAQMSVSSAAFKLLAAQLEAYLTFPVNTMNVIVDTTGMNGAFREEMYELCRKHGYTPAVVTFEYKNRAAYLEYTPEHLKPNVLRSLKRYNETVLPNLKLPKDVLRYRVGSRDGVPSGHEHTCFEGLMRAPYAAGAKAMFAAKDCLLPTYFSGPSKTYVIGDVHECVDELKALVTKIQAQDPGAVFVLNGDWMDKGGKTAEMIDYLLTGLPTSHKRIRGNHEAYLYRALKGEIKRVPELEASYFTAMAALEADQALKAKFFALYETSLDYAILYEIPDIGDNFFGLKPVIVTHAPADIRSLAKSTPEAIKDQRNFYFDREGDRTQREQLSHIYDQADGLHPWHVFGHVPHLAEAPSDLVFKNKVFLDTAAVDGGKLTAVCFTGDGPKFIQEDCSARRTASWEAFQAKVEKNLGRPVQVKKPFRLEDYDLSKTEWKVVDNVLKHGVRYVSGTMSPGPSTDDGIEPLAGAIEYLKRKGVTTICAQPKYMGSRAQAYFYADDPSKDMIVSRNGHIVRRLTVPAPEGEFGAIRHISGQEYAAFLAGERAKNQHLIDKYGSIILDCELTPWSALGNSLIQEQFHSYGHVVNSELQALQELSPEGDPFGFAAEASKLQLGALPRFSEALSRYDKVTAPELCPFDLLWAEKGGVPETPDARFKEVRSSTTSLPTACFTGRLDDEQFLTHLREAHAHLTVELGMEGFVLKPLDGDDKVPAYMKVRSDSYLHLVYGYDYREPAKLARLIRQKNISGKVAVSVREHRLGQEMLAATPGDRGTVLPIVVALIGEKRREEGLDPRL